MKPHRSPRQATVAPASQGGFALLITITLLAFLVLLLVSLASLTRVETQVSNNNQKQSQARTNAIFALNSALGQLQQFAGPDQRVTTSASLGDGSSNALPAPVNGARQWTGVWGNSNTPDTDRSAPVFLNWLVSGNEDVTVTPRTDGSISSAAATPAIAPGQAITNLASATALSSNVTINGQPARLLVGPGTVGTTAGGGLGETGYVAAPLQSINVPASSIPGKTGADTPVGRYAWWVGDEGIKARANLVESEDAISATAEAEKRLRYRAPARTGVELMTNAPAALAGADFEGTATTGVRTELRKVVSGSQLPLSGGGTLFPSTFLQQHFHDLSTTSLGVLSNTLAGGLRKDLTAAFAPGTTKSTAPTGPIWQLGTTDALKSADWQVLRSYYQLPFSSGASGTDNNLSIAPQAHIDGTTNSAQSGQQGIFPVIAAWQNHVEGRVNPPGPGSYGLELRYYPAIVLWNPYNVTLKDHTYHVTYAINGGDITYLRVSARAAGSPAYTKIPAAASPEAQLGTPFIDGLQIAVQSGDMAPGTAYVYTLKNDVYYSSNTFTPYTLQRGWNGGGTKSIIVTGNSFPLPTNANGYMVSLWAGTNNSGTNTIPSWADESATVPTASGSSVEPTIRDDNLILATNSGDVLQYVRSNNNYENAFKMRFVRTTLLFQDIRPIVGYIGHRWALKTTALGTIVNTTYHKNRPVRWLADYNPRAPLSARSPFEMQGDGYGYFQNNPNYNISTDTRRYSAGAYDPVNAGAAIACDPDSGRAFVAMSQDTWDGADESTAVLFNVPRAEHPLVSLGELQHAQPYRVNGYPFAANTSPAYPIGNSYAPPRGNIDATSKPWSDIAIGSGSGYNSYKATARVFDESYLLNRALWDGYFFSSVPIGSSSATVTFPLPNPRIALHDRTGSSLPGDLRDYEKSAASLMTSGSFNINSTSAQAWRALLASTNNVPVGSTRRTKESPYPRLGYTPVDSAFLDTAATTNAGMKANAYQGYRFLTEAQITALADQIVVQVRRRGPFVSLADFVNRGLDAGFAPATQDNRLKGALTQALETANVNSAFSAGVQASMADKGVSTYTSMNEAVATGLTATNVPGWVSQADLLQSLAPVISARSDTFIIRAYGEAINTALQATDSDYVQGRAWCEAVVQRMPEYVNSIDDPWKPVTSLIPINQTFGRRFQIVSFRWLTPNDI